MLAGAAAAPPAPPSVHVVAQRKATIAAAAPWTVTILGSGQLSLGGTPTTLETLVSDLKRKVSTDASHPAVYIRVDTAVKYEAFMAVLNTLQKSGFYKVSLITENRDK
jgi:biopolymer transport protein ExbD